jgi:hypothetical protein
MCSEETATETCPELDQSSASPQTLLLFPFGGLFHDAFSVTTLYSADDRVTSE